MAWSNQDGRYQQRPFLYQVHGAYAGRQPWPMALVAWVKRFFVCHALVMMTFVMAKATLTVDHVCGEEYALLGREVCPPPAPVLQFSNEGQTGARAMLRVVSEIWKCALFGHGYPGVLCHDQTSGCLIEIYRYRWGMDSASVCALATVRVRTLEAGQVGVQGGFLVDGGSSV